jgi:hypothetical protein
MEKLHYIEETDQLVTETIYDAEPVIEENAAIRASGPVEFGSKGQRLVLAMRIPEEHVTALRNEGYNLLSSDPEESRRAMLYVQANQAKFLTTDKKMIAERKQQWR